MKNKILITVLILSSFLFSCIQEKNISLIGKWKIISIDSGDFYINTKTDSIFISKKTKTIFKDSLELNNMINIAKKTYTDNTIDFNINGNYLQKNESVVSMSGTYKINTLDKKISVTTKDDINFEMDYRVSDSILYLTMHFYDEKSKFVLEKIER